MKKFSVLLGLISKYKAKAMLNVLLNVISVFFSIFSVLSIIPFLRIMFGHTQPIKNISEFQFTQKSMEEHLYYFLSNILENHGASTALMLVGGVMIFMTFLKTSFRYLSLYYLAPIQDGVVRDIRNRIFSKTLDLPLSYYSDERKGDLMARMTNDLIEIRTSVVSMLEVMFSAPISIIFYLITLFILSPELSVFVLIMMPFSAYIIGKVGKNLRRKSYAAQNKMGELLSMIEEAITGLRIINAFNAKSMIYNRFEAQNNIHYKISRSIQRRHYLAHPVSEMLGTIMMMVIMWYGATLVISGESKISSESFIAYLGLFYMIIPPAKAFTAAAYNIRKGLASVERINFILEADEKILDKPDAKPVDEFHSEVEYRNVSFKYVNDYVLKNINLSVKKGETIALVGQSGSGKSTLVDLLPRFYDIEEGQILVDNQEVKDLKKNDLRGLLGIVNQHPILFNDSIFNNIAFGLEKATEEQVIEAAKIANAHEFIVNTPDGYHSNIGDGGCKLSGGQRQRISIARAILKNPPILILDEATSALDTESERLVQDALTKLMKNRTSIVIAHRLSTIHKADCIYVMQDGKVVEQGKHDELLENNRVYKKLVELQKFA